MIKKSILLFTLIISTSLVAQKQQASPYSFFGIGTNLESKTIEESLMGGVGTAISDPIHLNFSNPAALSNLRFTTYAIGAKNSQTMVSDATTTQKSSIFSISYLAMGIPLGNSAALTAGFRGKSSVGYNLKEGDFNSVDGLYTYEGTGGASSLFMGGGVKVFKGLSVGLEGAFIFGDVNNTITYHQVDTQYDTRKKIVSTLRGFDTKFGLYYEDKVSKKNRYTLGLTFLKSKDITVSEVSSFYKGFFSSEFESIKSALTPVDLVGSIENPIKTTFAVGYGQFSKWHASLEYSFNDAVRYQGETLKNNTNNVVFNKYNRISLGGYYIPKFNSLTSYFSRMTYRAGLKYENLGMTIKNNDIKDFGMSFGIGLPMGKGLSDMNVGFEYGKKGKVNSDGLIEEKYFNVKLSLSLGDKWFNKRTID